MPSRGGDSVIRETSFVLIDRMYSINFKQQYLNTVYLRAKKSMELLERNAYFFVRIRKESRQIHTRAIGRHSNRSFGIRESMHSKGDERFHKNIRFIIPT